MRYGPMTADLNRLGLASFLLISVSLFGLASCATDTPRIESVGELSHDGLVPLQDTDLAVLLADNFDVL